jgi:fibronectin-binding autotransporter adhesin
MNINQLPRQSGFIVCLGLAFLLGLVSQGQASALTWDPLATLATGGIGGGTGTWDTGSWWSGASNGDGPWNSGNDAFFGGSAGTVSIVGGVSANNLIFNVSGYAVTGSVLTLTGGTVNLPNKGSSATIGSVIAGSVNLIQTGTGSLNLTAADSYSGTTTINGGTLNINGTNATTAINVGAKGALGGMGSAAAATAAITSGGSLDAGFGGQGSLTLGGLTFSNVASVFISNIGNYTSAAAIITGSNGLADLGSGSNVKFTLTGAAPTVPETSHLIKYAGSLPASLTGAGLINKITGFSSRGSLALTFTDTGYIDAIYSVDYPIWTGLGGGIWTTGTQSPSNWKLASSGTNNTPTDFLTNDIVVFDDSAGTATTVSISGTGSVNPASVTFNNNTRNYTLQGTYGIAGQTGLTINGSGSVTITNSNTYIGLTAVNAGTLQIGNGGSGASIGSTSGVNLAANALLIFSHSDAEAFAPPISGSGHVIQSGGVLTLAGSSSFSGGTAITAGTIQLGNNAGLGTGGLTLPAGTLLDLNSYSPAIARLSGSGTIDNVAAGGSPTLTIGNGGSNSTFSGTIRNTSGTVSLALASGSLFLTGPNTFSGTTTINGGRLYVGHALALQASTVNVSANNSLVFSVPAATLGGLSGGANLNLGATALTVGANSSNTLFSGSLSGGNGLTKIGSGTLALTSTNSYSGATNISGGVLRIGGNPVTAGLQYWLDASNPLSVSGTAVNSWNDISGNGRNFTNGAAAAPTLATGALNGLPVVQFDGATTSLNYAGAVNAQTVIIVNAPGGQAQTLPGIWGSYGDDNGIRLGDVSGTWRGNPNAAGNATDNNDFTNNAGSPGTTYISTSASFDVNTTTFGVGTPHIITAYGNSTYADTGLGQYYFSGGVANRFWAGGIGEVLVYNTPLGTAQRQAVEDYLMYKWFGVNEPGYATSGVLPSTTPVTISNGATLDMTNGTQTIASLSSTDGMGSQVLLGSSGLLAIAGPASTTFDGVISGNGSLVKQGGGVLTFTGSNTYTGTTTVSAGTLQLGDGAAHNGSVAGSIVNNSALVFANPAGQAFGGAISGSGSLIKAGAGTLVLTATQAYTGPTVVAAGTLQLGTAGVISGFGGSGTGWTLNGAPTVVNNVLTLTFNNGGEARTAFYNTQVPVGAFNASFVYQASGNKAADGVSFMLQNNGPTVIGGGGGSLGYTGITPSVGIGLNIYSAANGGNGLYLLEGGTVVSTTSTVTSAVLGSGDPIQTNITYDGTNIVTVMFDDLTTSSTYGTSYPIGNLSMLVGGNTAYMGFSGADGGLASTQAISNFIYNFAPSGTGILPPNTGLSVAKGATLDLHGANQTVGSLSGAGTVTTSSPLEFSTLTAGGDGTAQTFSGVLQNGAGTLGLTLAGPGGLTLSGPNTYSGPTTINGGVLAAGAHGALSPNSDFTINGGTLDVTNSTQTIQSLTFSQSGTLNLSIGNVLILAGTIGANLSSGTLNLFGSPNGTTEELLSYLSYSGSFATVNGLPSGYQLQYNSTQLDLIPPPGTSASWIAGSGSWSNGTNWSTGIPPNGIGTEATLSIAGSATVSITLDEPVMLSTLLLGNSSGSASGGYTITGTNSLAFANGVASALIAVTQGTHTIAIPVILGGNLSVTPSAGTTLAIMGNVSQSAAAASLTLSGPGTLILNGSDSYSGGTFVNAGLLIAESANALRPGSNLFVGAGASSFAPVVAGPSAGVSGEVVAVPEPGTWTMLLAVLLAGFGIAASLGRRNFLPLPLQRRRPLADRDL